MSNELVIALCSLLGTAIGAFSGSWQTRKLIAYRIEQLEIKVDKHNNLIERTAVLERDMKTGFRLIDGLRGDLCRVGRMGGE